MYIVNIPKAKFILLSKQTVCGLLFVRQAVLYVLRIKVPLCVDSIRKPSEENNT